MAYYYKNTTTGQVFQSSVEPQVFGNDPNSKHIVQVGTASGDQMRPGAESTRDAERPQVIQLNKPKPELKAVSTAGVLQNGVPISMAQVPQVTLERLGTQEEQAQRAKLARDLMVQQQAAQRQLASQQARAGIRGPAAVAQQARLSQQIAQQRAVQEEEGGLQRRLFNLDQAQKEQFANVASQLAIKQMASSLEGQKLIAQAAKEGATIQASAVQQGGKIICTELHRQGLLDDATFKVDQEFGKLMRENYPQVMIGYWTIAMPVVALMQKSKVFTHIVAFFAKPWAHHMAHLMGVKKTDNLFGKAIMSVGKPLCVFAGKGKKVYG